MYIPCRTYSNAMKLGNPALSQIARALTVAKNVLYSFNTESRSAGQSHAYSSLQRNLAVP